MNIISVLSIFVAASYIFLGLYVLSSNRKEKLNIAFLALCISFSYWGITHSFIFSSNNINDAILWYKISSLGWSFAPSLWLNFLLFLTDRNKKYNYSFIHPVIFIPSLINLYLFYFGKFNSNSFLLINNFWFENFNNFESYFRIFFILIFYLIYCVIGTIVLYKWYKSSSLKKIKKQFYIIMTGMLIFILLSTLNIGLIIIKIYLIPNIIVILGLIAFTFFWIAIVKYKLLNITDIITIDEIFGVIKDYIIITDNNGNIIKVNNSLLKSLNFSNEDLINKSISILFEEYEIWDSRYSLKDNKIVPEIFCITNLKTKNNEKIPIEITISNIKDNLNDIIGSIIIGHDLRETKYLQLLENEIEHRKKIEQELLLAKQIAESSNKAKSQFLANMSHEIRTPMNGITGMIELLEKTRLNKKQQNYLSIIKKSSSLLLNIINDVLDISKIEAGKMKLEFDYINIKDISSEIIEILENNLKTKNINLILEIDEKINYLIYSDHIRLKQIMLNVLNNAIKFSNYNSSIEFIIKEISKNNDKSIIDFIIRDYGIGIPEDKKDKIFESFYQIDNSTTKKYSGAGLGLAIVKQLVEMMNGTIEVESKLNQGSTFNIEIPFKISEIKLDQEQKKEDRLENKISNISILLVEDDEVNQLYIKEVIRRKKWKLEIASNGIEAIELFEKNKYDLILMDGQMPFMDGFETIKIIREKELSKDKKVKIIALSAYAMKQDKDKFMAAGADDFISKPINYLELISKIEKNINIGE